MVKVNRAKDYVERVGWTLAEVAIALPLTEWLTGDALSWWTPVVLGAIASLKVLVAQHAGRHDDGAAIPGGVIEDVYPK